MNRTARTRFLAAAFVASLLPLAAPLPASGQEANAAEVAAWLEGTFDSKDQATADPATYREIRVVAARVPNSRLGLGAPVLYVEQAATTSLEKPYRQRFYRIEDGGAGKVLSRIFEPKDLAGVRGKWREPGDLSVFGAGDVVERSGCLVTLRRVGDHYEGGTEGTTCPSVLQGARYATSVVRLFPDRLESWDRGYDASGKQVWGPEKAGYVFVRRPTPASAPPGASVSPARREERPATPPPTPPVAPAPGSALPPGLRTRSLTLLGVGTERRFLPVELRTLPMVESPARGASVPSKEKGRAKPNEKAPIYRGVSIADVLRAAGLATEGMEARRLLAPAVVVATASDRYVAVFSAEELLAPGAPFVAFEKDGQPLDEAEGPFKIVAPESRTRAIRNLVTLELRLLGENTPEEPRRPN